MVHVLRFQLKIATFQLQNISILLISMVDSWPCAVRNGIKLVPSASLYLRSDWFWAVARTSYLRDNEKCAMQHLKAVVIHNRSRTVGVCRCFSEMVENEFMNH